MLATDGVTALAIAETLILLVPVLCTGAPCEPGVGSDEALGPADCGVLLCAIPNAAAAPIPTPRIATMTKDRTRRLRRFGGSGGCGDVLHCPPGGGAQQIGRASCRERV